MPFVNNRVTEVDRRTFALSVLATAAVPRVATASPAPSLSPTVMRSDIALLGNAYRELHPGLLRYQTTAQFEARLAAFTDSCSQSLTLGDFYLRLARFLSTIRCGHSYPNFYNQTDAVKAALFANDDRLPILFRWLGDEMIVTGDPSATGIVPGSSILAIEGRPVRAVLAALLPFVRGDGGNDDKRRMLLSVQGDDEYETFDVFYPLRFGGRSRYRLTVRAPDGRVRTTMVAAIGLAARQAQRPPHGDPKSDNPLWHMEANGPVAVLTMPDWGVYDSKWDWRGWLEARLDEITSGRVSGLVIDLRANEGGLDCGDPIIARLIDRPVAPLPGRRLVRYRRVPDALRPILRTWDKQFYDWGDRAVPFDTRFFQLDADKPDGTMITPAGRRFGGKVAVLVGPQNSSATFNFAAAIQRERLGVLVGEPTGGNRRGINGGAFFNVRLPGSKLEADLPLIGSFRTTVQPDAGLIPDISVTPTARGIAAGRDEAMSQAKALFA